MGVALKQFKWAAMDVKGKDHVGDMEAVDEGAVKRELLRRGFQEMAVKEIGVFCTSLENAHLEEKLRCFPLFYLLSRVPESGLYETARFCVSIHVSLFKSSQTLRVFGSNMG
jgi:hypothetical protein